jgi:FkbM family methyltransferase
MDLWMIMETYVRSDYEVHGPRIGQNWTIIDIGAAAGDFAILAAQRSPQNKVYAIEPFTESFNLLNSNIRLNKIENVVPVKIAISDKKEVILKINENNLGNNGEYGQEKIHTIKSPAMPLEQLFKKYQINHCHLVKCDCEGAEFEIFNNLDKGVYQKIDHIVMEYHLFDSSFKLQQLITNFEQHGFQIKIYPNPVHKNIGFLWAKKNNIGSN